MSVPDTRNEESGCMNRSEKMKYITDTIGYVRTQRPHEYDQFMEGLQDKLRGILLKRLEQ